MADNTPQSRSETLLAIAAGEELEAPTPQSRIEKIFATMAGETGIVLEPTQSRLEYWAKQAAQNAGGGGGGYTPEEVEAMIAAALLEYEQTIEGGEYGTTPFTPSDPGPFNEDILVNGSSSDYNYANERALSVRPYAFYYFANLKSVSLASATTIGNYAFNSATALTSVDLPLATRIGDNAFAGGLTSLTTVNIPSATTVSYQAFKGCTSLVSIDLPSLSNGLGNSAFQGCTSLALINLYSPNRQSAPSSFASNGNVLTSTPIAAGNGYIVINDELVDTLKATTGWKTYKDQIIGKTAYDALI